MAEINNEFKITGTIYNLEYNEIQGVKDPSAKYAKYLVTLEVKKTKPKKDGVGIFTSTELPQFEAFGMNLDEYSRGDLVEIRFYLSGKEYDNKKTGKKGIFNKSVLTYIRHADLDAGHPDHKGVIKADDPVKKEFFIAPPSPDDAEGLTDLPF